MYDMTIPNNTIKTTKIWKDTAEIILENLDGYDDLEKDCQFVFTTLFSKNMITYDQLYVNANAKKIVMMIAGNVYYDYRHNNMKFVRKFLKALLTRDYGPLKTKAFDFLKGHETEELLARDGNVSVLTYLLDKLGLSKHKDLSILDIPERDTVRSVFRDDDISHDKKNIDHSLSLSFKTHSYDANTKALYFKDIIKGLLKLESKNFDSYTLEDIHEIYKYKDSLKDVLDINLDDYKFKYLGDTPVSLSLRSKRTVDQYSPTFKVITVNDKNNVKKKIVKIGNLVYDMDTVKFIDKHTIQIDDKIYHTEDANDKQLQKLKNMQEGNIFKKKVP
ncbi:hypothetical protein EBR96_11285, partial [bacterium]|nr:hypothetical protein [bacterium]